MGLGEIDRGKGKAGAEGTRDYPLGGEETKRCKNSTLPKTTRRLGQGELLKFSGSFLDGQVIRRREPWGWMLSQISPRRRCEVTFRTVEKRSLDIMLRRSFTCVTGLLALTLAIHGCSSGGGSGGGTAVAPSPSGGTTVVLDSTQGTTAGSFGFTITDLQVASGGGGTTPLSPYTTTPVGVDYEFDGAGNDGHVVGVTNLAEGNYISVTLTYENARVILPSGEFLATPSFGTINVPLRGPLNVAAGDADVVNLTVDIAATVTAALTGGGGFQPSVFGRCVCTGEVIPLAEFEGNVVGVDSGNNEITVAALARQAGGPRFPIGQLPIHVAPGTVAITSDDIPRETDSGLGILSGIVGEAVEVEATIDANGMIAASSIESDNVGFQGQNQVQLEGVIVEVGQDRGAPEFGLFVTRIEDDDLNQFPSGVSHLPLRFISAAPRVFFEGDRSMAGVGRLEVGMLIEAEGFVEGAPIPQESGAATSGTSNGVGNTGGGSVPAIVTELPEDTDSFHFMASAVEVRSQFLFGTVTESFGEGLFQTDVQGVESLPSSLNLDLLVNSHNVVPMVDGVLPIDPSEILPGSEVILFGSFSAFNDEQPQPTALGVPIPTPLPENVVSRDFDARILFLRGREFDAEEITQVDSEVHQFVVSGDARSLGLDNPTNVTIFLIRDVRTIVKGTSSIALGISRTRIFDYLEDASTVTLRGYLAADPASRGVSTPLFIATSIEIELGGVVQPL